MEGKEAQRGATEKAHSVARQRETHTHSTTLKTA